MHFFILINHFLIRYKALKNSENASEKVDIKNFSFGRPKII